MSKPEQRLECQREAITDFLTWLEKRGNTICRYVDKEDAYIPTVWYTKDWLKAYFQDKEAGKSKDS